MPKICYFVKVLIFIIHSKTYYCEQIDHERSTILRMSFYTCHFEKMCLCVTSKNFHVNVIKSLSMSTCHMVSIYSMYYLKNNCRNYEENGLQILFAICALHFQSH